VLVVGGAPGLTGAVSLSAEAAFRADAGYVTVCAPRESLPIVELRLLEAVKRPLEEAFDAAERAGALALGPGLGRGDDARQLVRRLLEDTDLPAVVDADGLFGFESVERAAPTVLTPHSGELARLLEVEDGLGRRAPPRRCSPGARAVQLHRPAERNDTIVAAPGARTLISAGTPRLATAGTGDVLTGSWEPSWRRDGGTARRRHGRARSRGCCALGPAWPRVDRKRRDRPATGRPRCSGLS
jgi:NAD(P)H-hydrate epimerase